MRNTHCSGDFQDLHTLAPYKDTKKTGTDKEGQMQLIYGI